MVSTVHEDTIETFGHELGAYVSPTLFFYEKRTIG